MILTKDLKRVGGFKDYEVSEDSDLHQRIKKTYTAKKIKTIKKILYKASFNENSKLFRKGLIRKEGVHIEHIKSNYETTLNNSLGL